MVSQSVINIFGVIGGVVLAICQAPQLLKLYRTKSAADLSYWYLNLYCVGLFFITMYLYLEKATVGWICEAIEFACGVVLIVAKWWLDNYGPLGRRRQQKLQQHQKQLGQEQGSHDDVETASCKLVRDDSSRAVEAGSCPTPVPVVKGPAGCHAVDLAQHGSGAEHGLAEQHVLVVCKDSKDV